MFSGTNRDPHLGELDQEASQFDELLGRDHRHRGDEEAEGEDIKALDELRRPLLQRGDVDTSVALDGCVHGPPQRRAQRRVELVRCIAVDRAEQRPAKRR